MLRFTSRCARVGRISLARHVIDRLQGIFGGVAARPAVRRRSTLADWQAVEALEQRLVLTPAVTIGVAPNQVEEDVGNTLFYTFTRTETAGALVVNFAVSGTAAFGTDYTQTGATTFTLTTGTVTFANGSPTATVTVNVTPDNNTEPDETASLTVTAGGGYTIGASSVATGTIINDDSLVSIAADAASQAEGNTFTTPFTFTLTRSGDLSDSDTVDYVVTGSGMFPATAADFGGSFPTGTVVFAQGVTSQTVTINVSGETVGEADERFTVTLQNPSAHLFIGTPSASTVITNDDPILDLSALSVAENLPVGSVVGTLNIGIAGVVDPQVFTLVSGIGDTNNASFSISGNQLLTTESFNYENKASYSIRVHGHDSGTIATDRVFTISINDTNDPTVLALGAATPVAYTKKPVFVFQTLTVQDPDNTPAFRLPGGQLIITMNTVVNSKGKSADVLKLQKLSTLGTSAGLEVVGNELKLNLTLSQSTSVMAVQAFLRSITFKTKKPGLSVAQRTVDLELKDASSNSASVNQTINVGV